ncbi:MAG: nucleoside monophosphate kinase [Patescibacteria group bacterium]|nr:nucleoside monophosphate kinase [Patescibacteria group bacterium]
MKNIILFGAPGAGKGTLIELLGDKGFQFSLVNPGQMLRDITKEDSEFGRKIKETMARGELVDDFLVTELVKKKIRELEKGKPIIFDGYPRSLGQVEIVDEIFTEAGFDLPYLVFVKISKEEAVKRLSARRVCSECKENFQDFEMEDPEKCPKCGGKIIQREDDKPIVIEERFEIFNLQFKIIDHYFKSRDRYFEIDGTIPKEERVEELIEIIKS